MCYHYQMTRNAVHNRTYRKANPLVARAHWMVQEALRSDRLRKGPCEACGSLKVQGHHEDYSKPLEVRWLCHKHHVDQHYPNGPTPRRSAYVPVPPDQRKPRPAVKRDTFKAQAVGLAKQGQSYRQIGQLLQVSPGTVYKWLNAVNYK